VIRFDNLSPQSLAAMLSQVLGDQSQPIAQPNGNFDGNGPNSLPSGQSQTSSWAWP
jgi:hypothetical protein